ncbi:MAG: glutathione peroxidase [Alphaproteobacteria bacterium]|nr:glutathione peroxidase [Alphaproteobacteria bacterium]
MSAHDFEFTAIDGKLLRLADFRGKAVLVVNTASQCGLTPQYAGLQKLWESYRDKGLVVLGVPSNDFGGQEPGSEAEIRSFCDTRYRVTFPMTAKYPVIGAEAHPFYRWAEGEAGEAGAPKWNFHKFLVGPDGALAGVFGSRAAPDAPDLVAAIEDTLAGC